jgi:hypothetical protein
MFEQPADLHIEKKMRINSIDPCKLRGYWGGYKTHGCDKEEGGKSHRDRRAEEESVDHISGRHELVIGELWAVRRGEWGVSASETGELKQASGALYERAISMTKYVEAATELLADAVDRLRCVRAHAKHGGECPVTHGEREVVAGDGFHCRDE